MFAKLLKYDMKAVWRLGWISAVIVPIAAVIAAFSSRYYKTAVANNSEDLFDVLSSLISGLLIFACFAAIFLSFVLTAILVFVRFFKNFFTDEGYLTFTLPVTRAKLLFSKTLSAFIWFTAHFLLILISLAVFFLLNTAPEADDVLINPQFYENASLAFEFYFSNTGGWSIAIVAEIFFLILFILFMSVTLIQLSITIGSVIAKKAKIIVSIGIYYLINTIMTLFWQAIYMMFALCTASSSFDNVMIGTANELGAVVTIVLLIVLAICAAFTSLFYCCTQNLLERRLNLA